MKVLFLTNIPSPYRVDFFNELGKICNLTVLYERKKAKNRNDIWQSKNKKNFKEIFLKGIEIGDESSLSFKVLKYLRDKSYDVIVIGGYSTLTGMLAIKYLRMKKIPFILSSDGGFIKKDSAFKFNIKKYFISSAKAWLSTGENTTNYLINYGAEKKGIYVYPFTSIKKEDVMEDILSNKEKNNIRKNLGIKYDKVIISVGQFIHRKGYDILLNSCKDLSSEIGVYIIGGDPTNEYLELKSKIGLKNVHFIEFKSSEELKEYYKCADLFVLPTREDIWGLVINEAMSFGLPVITTKKCIAGLELVKENKNGYIIDSEDSEQLSEKIKYILNNENIKENMSKNSLKIISKYTIESMAKSHNDIFRDYIKQYKV